MRNVVLLLAVILAASLTLAEERAAVEKVLNLNLTNLAKIDPFVTELKFHAIWPEKEYLREHMCEKKLIDPDVAALKQHLVKVLREGLRPTDQDFNGIVGVKNYMEEMRGLPDCVRFNDYLFLKYTNSFGITIEIQEGQDLNIMFIPKEPQLLSTVVVNTGLATNRLADYTRDVAIKCLNYSSSVNLTNELNVSQPDCEKMGFIYWGSSTLYNTYEGWFSRVRWWSDGRRVLFSMATKTKEEVENVPRGAAVPSLEYRRFQYRKDKKGARD